ncbi:glycosyltransferase family 2 protein [Gordonia sp. FQ]|uniref:glycosyltransferase family 2 protein n=1 Tax=Gordonia sp. FQ TaxID=3446634 RepID=UPI003F846F82
MTTPTVGVVIPVYRCAPYVRGCLESVLAQTHPVDQIVLVDDRGGDESVRIAEDTLREHARDYTLITQVRNGGLGRARNTGLDALDTDLVWFLDSDDQAHADFVETLLGALTAADADFAVCRTHRVDPGGRVLQTDEAASPAPVVDGDVYARELLRGRVKAYACTKLFRRDLLGDRPWPEDQAYEDLAAAVRLALRARRVAMVDRALYRYLYREGSLSTALSDTTFDLFTAGDEVRTLVAASGLDWHRDYLAFRYRQVLISVAHLAMRADHASPRRPPLYATAIRRVQDGVALRDLPALLAERQFRSCVFAVLMKSAPGVYSAVLRRR